MKNNNKTVDEYIASYPKEVQSILKKIRNMIIKSAPKVVESISYGMPGYKLHGKPFVYFGGFEHHIGFYPTPSGTTKFKKELSKYKSGKGSVQFQLDEPIPFDLIQRIIEFRIRENVSLKR